MDLNNKENEKDLNASKMKPTQVDEIIINNVTISLVTDPDENYSNLKTVEDLLKLDKKKPGIIKSISPKLYSAFKSAVHGTLEPYVNKGDKVRYRNPKHGNVEEEYTVEYIELSGINSMSIFTAKLSNGDLCLSNYLKKVG